MLHRLANLNPDIQRLLEKGYAISFDSNFLVIRDIPYLDDNKNLKFGAIVSNLVFVNNDHVRINDHQIFFCGSHPCELDGSLIKNLGGGQTTLALKSPDLVVQRSFSNRPITGAFANLVDKIDSYVTLFSGPAMELYKDVTPYSFNSYEDHTDSVFKFNDTLTSRAAIGDLASKLSDDVIAIIGLGGTGAYILDFLVKTPVKEIRGFDLDWYHVHNSYRSPGKLDSEELGKKKAEVYQKRYESFRSGINLNSKYIQVDSDEDLAGVTFAFVCVDKGSSRSGIFDLLIRLKIPFIDVGMGLKRDKGAIDGMMRVTYYSPDLAEELLTKGLAPMHDEPDDIYKNNIQISELNALNACFAVMRYKQIRGFYEEENSIHHMLFTTQDFHNVGE